MSVRLSRAEFAKLGLGKKGISQPSKKRPSKARQRIDDISHLDQEAIEMSFPLRPQTKDRPRFSVDEDSVRRAFAMSKGSVDLLIKNIRVKAVTSKKTRDFEKEVSRVAALLMMGRTPLHGPVEIYVKFVLPGDENMWPISKQDGDLDNHEKAFFDALNDIVYDDDCLIVRKITEKVFGGKGIAEIQVFAAPACLSTSLGRFLGGRTP